MKIPVEWLRQYIDTNKTDAEIAEVFTALGLMLETNPNEINGVLDLEHRMDRADWLSILGCARDFSAMENIKLKMPEFNTTKGLQTEKPIIDIRIETDMVRRFDTRVIKNITVKDSPEWLQKRLREYGMPTINNIVDITNYVMLEFGQPMHAQDIAKFRKPEIVIRDIKPNEKMTTLDGTEVALPEIGSVLTQDGVATVITGIVGGRETGVTSTTKDIVLDAGNYDQVRVRKASRLLKIQNETVSRCDKFLHPQSCELAINRAVKLILELAGGEYYENYDYYPNPPTPKEMEIRLSRLKKISGMNVEMSTVTRILTALEYKIVGETPETLKVQIPFFRTDIEVEDDIVADILRINNYKNIPVNFINAAPPVEITSDVYKFEQKLREVLVRLGLHEHRTDPLVKSQNADNASTQASNQVTLQNALNSEKTALRTTLYETLKPVVNTYTKHKISEAQIFEVGKSYVKKGGGDNYENMQENRQVCVIYANSELDIYGISKKTKELLSTTIRDLGLENLEVRNENGEYIIYLQNVRVGHILADNFVLDTEVLATIKPTQTRVQTEIPNISTLDVTLVVIQGENAGPVISMIKQLPNIINVEFLGEYIDQKAEDKQRAISLQIAFTSHDKEELVESIGKVAQLKR